MTPKEWTYAPAQLTCLRCGQTIALNDSGRIWFCDTWEASEMLAASIQARGKHTCTVDLRAARQAMQDYRATHPPMTFEEECKVYNEIMKSQTYL